MGRVQPRRQEQRHQSFLPNVAASALGLRQLMLLPTCAPTQSADLSLYFTSCSYSSTGAFRMIATS